MSYTIMNAIGTRYAVDLSRDGQEYFISVYDKAKNRLEACERTESFGGAVPYFESMCDLYNVSEFIKEVEHDENEFGIWAD